MCQLTRSESLDPKSLTVSFLVMLYTAWVIDFLIINSKVLDMNEGTIMESRDATFFEAEFLMKNTPSTSSHDSIFFRMTMNR